MQSPLPAMLSCWEMQCGMCFLHSQTRFILLQKLTSCRMWQCSGQLVNQFPYEACIIRKDLLPATLRRLHAAEREADPQREAAPQDAPAASWHPQWFPPAFDLATEVQYFLRDYAEVRCPSPAVRRLLMSVRQSRLAHAGVCRKGWVRDYHQHSYCSPWHAQWASSSLQRSAAGAA